MNTEERQYRLHMNGRDIVVRPRRDGETFPTHSVYRILFGSAIVTVGGCNKMDLTVMSLHEPEKRWKKCPLCKKGAWSVWVPLSNEFRYQVHGEPSCDFVLSTEWYIGCRHCGTLVSKVGHHELYPGRPTEYVFDPAQDEEFLTHAQRTARQRIKKH